MNFAPNVTPAIMLPYMAKEDFPDVTKVTPMFCHV